MTVDSRYTNPKLLAALLALLLSACGPAAGPRPSPAATVSAKTCDSTLLPRNQHLTSIVLIDQTTVLPEPDVQQFVREMGSDIRLNGGRVQVLAFGGANPALLRKVVDRTFAARSTGDSGPDAWTLTPVERRAAAECLEAGHAELELALSRTLETVDTRNLGHSPVLEAISAALGRREHREGLVRLIVVSDAIEHAGVSFYGPRSDSLRLPTPEAAVAELRKLDALPDARKVFVWHVAFGWNGMPAKSGLRTLRPPAETAALRRIYDMVWKEAGAAAWVYGEPMPTRGFDVSPPQVDSFASGGAAVRR